MRILFTGGGTGGHIFPALAVIESLKKKCPDAEILFIGGLYGPEKELVEKAGKTGIMIGADCTLPGTIDVERIGWVVEAAKAL